MAEPRLELTGEPTTRAEERGAVPPPLPPDDPEAWYAPDVQAQYEVHPGVVVTVRARDVDFKYEVREPALTAADRQALAELEHYFENARLQRPLTRQGAIERMTDGFDPKHEVVIDRLTDLSPAAGRRITYHALTTITCLDELTPYALDERITVADTEGEHLVVHTEAYAPAKTDLPSDPEFLERFASERRQRHTVEFHEFEIPVVIYEERLLGKDPFTMKYAVQEPDLLPGDEELLAECKRRLWETGVEGVIDDKTAFVRERAREFLSRRLASESAAARFGRTVYRLRDVLASHGVGIPPVDRRYDSDRLSDLVYYVLRDYVGYGKLTVPIRDPTLEDIEANQVGERIKVIPRSVTGHNERVPTNLAFESEQAFVNVVTQLAAADGTELNAATPSAKVNLRPAGVEETIRCAVALPTVSEGGPHISIRKQAPDVMTPVDLIERDSMPSELVALLWLYFEHHGVVLFSGPTGVGKTTLLNAHMPFIPFEDRPISIDEGSREVRLPHETGVSLTTRDHESSHKRVTMADLMTECNYLNPDVEVIAEINTSESFQTFAESLNTGHGLVGTTHAADVETLVNRVVEQGLPPYLLREIDLVVFPRQVEGKRYVGEVVELLSEREFARLPEQERCGVINKRGTAVYWNTVARRTADGGYQVALGERAEPGDTADEDCPESAGTPEGPPHSATGESEAAGGADSGGRSRHSDAPRPETGAPDPRETPCNVFARIGTLTDRDPETVAAEYRRKHRYVRYMVQEGIDDADDLFDLLADLRTNEAATVERLQYRRIAGDRENGVGD